MYEKRQHVGCDPKRDPRLDWPTRMERPVANTALSRHRPRWQLRRKEGERQSVLVVAIEMAGAHPRLLQLLALRDLVGKPVQSSGGVGVERAQARHLTDLGRDGDQVTPVEVEFADDRELGDRGRQRHDVGPEVQGNLRSRREPLAAIGCGLVDEAQEKAPCLALRVLRSRMDIKLRLSLGDGVTVAARARGIPTTIP